MNTQIEKLDGTIKQKDMSVIEVCGPNDFSLYILGNGHFNHKANHISVWTLCLTTTERNNIIACLSENGLSVKCTVQQSKTEILKDYPKFYPYLCDKCVECPLYWSLFVPKTQEELFLKGTSPCYIIREDEENSQALLALSSNYKKYFNLCTYFHPVIEKG